MLLPELDDLLDHVGVEVMSRVGSLGFVEEAPPSVLLEPLN
jgi:hypothetical protein